jgi:hypothetical protein
LTRTNVGGRLTYQALAELHRPSDPAAIAREVRRLHNTGLKARDIAVALRIAPDQVMNMLEPPP